MEVKIIKNKISQGELMKIAQEGYVSLVKAVVDIERKIVALGGEWHSEGQEELIKNGSSSKGTWGVNIFMGKPKETRIEFVALMNLKPFYGHRSMEITDELLKQKIQKIIDQLIE